MKLLSLFKIPVLALIMTCTVLISGVGGNPLGSGSWFNPVLTAQKPHI